METKTDDHDLILKYLSNRDPGLREAVILRYVPLVHYILGRLGLSQTMGADYEDATSQGLMGLIEAVDHYEPAYGTQFSTYATLRVRGKVLDHLRSLDWLSRGARQRVRSVQEAINTLWEKFLRAPSDEELSAYLNIDMPRLRQVLVDSSRMMVSLDSTVETNDEETTFHELLPDEDQVEPSEMVEEEELKERLIQALAALSEREQQVLAMYYYEDLTFKEIGEVLAVSESRICQIHGRALMNLRAYLTHASENPSSLPQVFPVKSASPVVLR